MSNNHHDVAIDCKTAHVYATNSVQPRSQARNRSRAGHEVVTQAVQHETNQITPNHARFGNLSGRIPSAVRLTFIRSKTPTIASWISFISKSGRASTIRDTSWPGGVALGYSKHTTKSIVSKGEPRTSSHGAFMSVSISGIYQVTIIHENTRSVTEIKLVLGQNIHDPAERL